MSEYTPTTEKVRGRYATAVYEFNVGGAVPDPDPEFDRWYAAEVAAAEQRGAVIVMDALKREASDPSWEGIIQPGRSLQELVDHIEHGIRADQMEESDDN